MSVLVCLLVLICGVLIFRLCKIQKERAKCEQEINERLSAIHDWD